MFTSEIILVILSGLGVIHGLFLAIFLWSYAKGDAVANKLLGLLLSVLSLRIGKSVFLEFAEDLDIKLIFTGLSFIFALGPLYYLLVVSCSNKAFQLKRKHLLHFVPLPIAFCFALWVEESHLTSLPLVFFVAVFAAYYLHFLLYLGISYGYLRQKKKTGLDDSTYQFLRLLFFGLSAIWVVYVLNLFEEQIPYIIGPILYSIVVYGISFIVIKKGYIEKINYTKYQTTSVSDRQSDELFSKVLHLMKEEGKYKDPNLTLKSLSFTLKVSPQVLSMVINRQSQQNFNSFINSFRIAEAIRLFSDEKCNHQTIAAIALDVGFNSISSFNTAFKKQTGKTPLNHRNEVLK